MGEIADMILDGTLCQECGAFIGEAVDYPRSCNSCGGTHSGGYLRTKVIARTNCPICNKRVKKAGLADHMRDVHQKGV